MFMLRDRADGMIEIVEITVCRCEDRREYERYDLWMLASELEAKLP